MQYFHSSLGPSIFLEKNFGTEKFGIEIFVKFLCDKLKFFCDKLKFLCGKFKFNPRLADKMLQIDTD